MSLTKIGSIGINTGIQFAGVTTIATLNGSDAVLSVGGTVNFVSDVSIGGSVSIGGTLTYEDVTNIDSVGLITARNGIVVGSGITLSKDGDIFATGVSTFVDGVKVGSGITLSPDGDIFATGITTIQTDSQYNGVFSLGGALQFHTDSATLGIVSRRSGSGGNFFVNDPSSSSRIRTVDGRLHISADENNEADDSEIRFIIDGNIRATVSAGSSFILANDPDTFIGHPSNNELSVTTAGSERLRINSDGRLLVNSTAARNIGGANNRIIQVESSGGGAGIAVARNQNTASGPVIDLGKSRGYPHTIVQADDRLGGITFAGADGTDLETIGAQILGEVDGTPGENDMPGRLVFKTNAGGSASPAQRLRITSNGQLLVGGQSSPHNSAYKIDIQTDTTTHLNGVNVRATALQNDTLLVAALAHATPSGAATNRRAHIGVYRNGSSQPGGYVYMHQQDGGNSYIWPDSSNVLRIGNALSNVTNDAGTVVGSQTSDIRLKNVLGNVTYGLAEINKINPIQFNFKNDKNVQKRIGFSAQDLQSIIPESVYNTKNTEEVDGVEIEDVLGMEYTQITPVLVNAIKELSTEIDKLKAEVAALKGG